MARRYKEELPLALIIVCVLEIVVLSAFLIEHGCTFFVMYLNYCKNPLLVVDLCAVAVSLVFEILYLLQSSTLPMGFLVVIRFWRFLRIGNHTLMNRRVGMVSRRRRFDMEKLLWRNMALQQLDTAVKEGKTFNFATCVAKVVEGRRTEQGKRKLPRELKRSSVITGREIGAGQFGRVLDGRLKDGSHADQTFSYPVAIKVINDDAPPEATMEVFEEAYVVAQLNHENIVSLCGVVTQGKPFMIVLEFATGGDLLSYLKTPEGFKLHNLHREHMAANVAHGLEYMHDQKVIHRDIAARNILLMNDLTCKVSDFGLAVLMKPKIKEEFDVSVVSSNGDDGIDMDAPVHDKHIIDDTLTLIPLRWVAPEVVNESKYSEKSDLWSFGVLMWEIFTGGRVPYGNLSTEAIYRKVSQGAHPKLLKAFPSHIREVLLMCWTKLFDERPTFADVSPELRQQRKSILQTLEDNDDEELSRSGSVMWSLKKVREELEEFKDLDSMSAMDETGGSEIKVEGMSKCTEHRLTAACANDSKKTARKYVCHSRDVYLVEYRS